MNPDTQNQPTNQQPDYNFILGNDAALPPQPKKDKRLLIIIGLVVLIAVMSLVAVLSSKTNNSVVEIKADDPKTFVTTFHKELTNGATSGQLSEYASEKMGSPDLFARTLSDARQVVNLTTCNIDESKTVDNTYFYYDCKT
ncbi:hypothetical protein KDA00_00345, partial [Candidatus Saccharibacteria bacterium]|nr:hypothetical protein [Candidatus Saccharibacteria bacterium]